MKRLVLVVGFFCVTAPCVFGFSDEVDRYVDSLNSPAVQDALGLVEVRRSEGIANRLEVMFESHPSPQQRSEALHQIGREFLRVLFRYELIPVAIVAERNASGRIVGSITVTVSGRPVIGPDTVPQASDLC